MTRNSGSFNQHKRETGSNGWGEFGANDVRRDELDRRLRERLDALGPAPRVELLHVLMLPDFDRA